MSPQRPPTHRPGSGAPAHHPDRAPDHRTVRNDAPAAFYASSAWKALRNAHRIKEPLCRVHAQAGYTVVAEMVDHIVPIARGGAPLDDDNLESLCCSCHQRKTEREKAERGT